MFIGVLAALFDRGACGVARIRELVDDDETVPQTWLISLIETQQRSQADAVFGRSYTVLRNIHQTGSPAAAFSTTR